MREREAEGRAGCGQGRDRVAGGQNPGAEGMQNGSALEQTGEGLLVLSGLQSSVWIFSWRNLKEYIIQFHMIVSPLYF